MKKEMKLKENMKTLLNSKKALVCIIFINIIIIVGLCLYLHSTFSRRISSEAIKAENGGATTESLDIAKINSEMSNVYSSLLSGWTFQPADDVSFTFGTDGTYSGFFDADNTNVEGYSYEITLNDSGQYVLNIFNEDKSKVVSYIVSLDDDGNIVLNYKDSVDGFVLSF